MGGKNCPSSSSSTSTSSAVILRFFAGVCFVLLATFPQNTVAKDINALVGSTAELPCTVDVLKCGGFYSIKWYRDTSRVYVFSQHGSVISRPEGDAQDRMSVVYLPNDTDATLEIHGVELQDEANYKCEITYLEVRENCDVVQIVKLQTMVPPERAIIFWKDPNQETITNTTFGPNDEGKVFGLTCQANGGKPEPVVKWYKESGEVVKGVTSTTVREAEGLFTVKSKLDITLSRSDLRARYNCVVTSPALKEPMVSWLTMDVHVKPERMELDYQEQVVQGNVVQFICDVFGANPAADVKWYNDSYLITNESLIQTFPEAMPIITKVIPNTDGTFVTKSELQFKATRWDDAKHFKCYAENSVTRNRNDIGYNKQGRLQVKFPPVVSVDHTNITRNETSAASVLIKCLYEANPVELTNVYWMKDGKNLTLIPDKHKGGTKTVPFLTINNVTRDDMGEYVCTCTNQVGSSRSENSAYLNVYYPPTVELIMDPAVPVKSIDGINVTAVCNVISGNPSSLLKVKWFLGDELLKELPECNYTSNDYEGPGGMYCNVDPIVLSLVTVDQSFAGNYTCQGMNHVGWGSESDPTELAVYYPPSPAKLTYTPSKVIKRGQVELQCSVDNPGKPENLSYVWYRGIHKLSSETGSKMIINPVKLDTRNNFTCMAINEGGKGDPSTVFINVSAPPTFITSLKYQHVMSFQTNMSLTCRVECSPLCFISWFKGNEQIDTRNNRLYDVKTTIRDANAKTGDFESIESTLIWNVHEWPTHPFAKTTPMTNYTCFSSSNGVGNGVNSTVIVEVQYPPENLTLSHDYIPIVEHGTPHEVNCSGKGNPYLHYEWKNASSNEVISQSQTLSFKKSVTRWEAGKYICIATNSRGVAQKEMILIVEYAPECTITRGKHEGNNVLICTVNAKPHEVSFTWMIKNNNDSSEEHLTTSHDNARGYLVLDSSVDSFRTYQCYANNSAGMGNPCEMDVTEVAAPWWQGLFGITSISILYAIIGGIILCALFVCIIIIIIICVCRKRRARNKLPNQSTTADRGRLGGPLNDGSTDPLTDPNKGFYENLPFHGMQTPPNKTNGATQSSDTYIF